MMIGSAVGQSTREWRKQCSIAIARYQELCMSYYPLDSTQFPNDSVGPYIAYGFPMRCYCLKDFAMISPKNMSQIWEALEEKLLEITKHGEKIPQTHCSSCSYIVGAPDDNNVLQFHNIHPWFEYPIQHVENDPRQHVKRRDNGGVKEGRHL